MNKKQKKLQEKMIIRLDTTKIPNKMHLDAQMLYPSHLEKDRSKFDRASKKQEFRKILKESF